ncbi:unnamed protein product, partial [Rotaria magnacalcarata]
TSYPSEKEDLNNDKSGYVKFILDKFLLFGKSVYVGGKIIFTKRRFIWLWSGYSVALYSHRYLENCITP